MSKNSINSTIKCFKGALSSTLKDRENHMKNRKKGVRPAKMKTVKMA